MFDPPPLRPPQSVAEALGTGEIPDKLSAILTTHSQTVREDGTDLMPKKRLGRRIHSFLAQLASGVDPLPGLERVTVVGVNPYGRVHLMHLLLSVWVNAY